MPCRCISNEKNKAKASEPRNCATCRECLKLDGVELEKIKDHFFCKYVWYDS